MSRLTILIFFISTSIIVKAQDNGQVIYLWPGGTPGFESLKNEPEKAKDWWVKNIHNPSLTVYLPPKEKANGSAVIICPGGGHRELVFDAEGKDAAEYFNNMGITSFVLKYRLFREENSPYKQEHALEDGKRALRLVKQQAPHWNLDTSRIGLMGFSAGGELAAWVSFSPGKNFTKADSTDNQKGGPSFLILIYPGPLAVPASVEPGSPPLFMLAANDDECCSEPVLKLMQLYRDVKIKAELHLYAQGNHAFNMGKRSSLQSIKAWPQRMGDWLTDNGFLKK